MLQRLAPLSTLALAAVMAAGCVVPEGRTHVDANVSATNAFIFRGVPQVDGLSIQPEFSVAAPEYSGGTYYGTLWGNLNATDDSGDGVLPDDRAGEFSRIDLIGGYTRPFPLFEVSAEVMNYNYPNFSGRSTTEVALGIGTDKLYGNPTISAYYDIDEIEGFYLNASLSEAIELREDLSLGLNLSLGWMDSDQGLFYIGANEEGFADAVLSARLDWFWYEQHSFWTSASLIQMVDEDYRDALDAAGIDDTNVVFMVGSSWRL